MTLPIGLMMTLCDQDAPFHVNSRIVQPGVAAYTRVPPSLPPPPRLTFRTSPLSPIEAKVQLPAEKRASKVPLAVEVTYRLLPPVVPRPLPAETPWTIPSETLPM